MDPWSNLVGYKIGIEPILCTNFFNLINYSTRVHVCRLQLHPPLVMLTLFCLPYSKGLKIVNPTLKGP